MRSTVLSAVLMIVVLSGCVSTEGIRLPSGPAPSEADLEDFSKRNAPSAQLPDAKVTQSDKIDGAQPDGALKSPAKDLSSTPKQPPDLTLEGGPRLIVIGNVMALKAYDDQVLNQRYDNYLKVIAARNKKPEFTREWYVSNSAGTVAVKVGGVPGLISFFRMAEVPKALVSKIEFANSFATFMVGASADLVAAEIDPALGIWITRLLCSVRDAGFAECESRFARGIFQSSDGREVDNSSLKPKDSGATIDLTSYARKR